MGVHDAANSIAVRLNLSEADLEELVPSGQQTRFYNRVTWAKTYLKKAGLVTYPSRGHFVATDRGREFLEVHDGPIRPKDLRQFSEFEAFATPTSATDVSDPAYSGDELENTAPPDELITELHTKLNSELADELIERVQAMPPIFFERLLVQLLVNMGYGGTADEAGRDLGKSGDGGVDGVIDQDRLGVDQVYIQAKRYADDNPVGPGAIRDFFGALNMKRATKGIFFTTSSFTKSARETAAALGTRIVLINGRQLARLMIETKVGCREETTLVIHRIDEDFFDNA